jgi:hypothetical protein
MNIGGSAAHEEGQGALSMGLSRLESSLSMLPRAAGGSLRSAEQTGGIGNYALDVPSRVMVENQHR